MGRMLIVQRRLSGLLSLSFVLISINPVPMAGWAELVLVSPKVKLDVVPVPVLLVVTAGFLLQVLDCVPFPDVAAPQPTISNKPPNAIALGNFCFLVVCLAAIASPQTAYRPV